MCGIAGFCDFNKKSNKETLKNMTDILYHRGPDDYGYNFYSLSNCNIGLGHRRLSILDLSSHGHQPMKFDNLEIVYNGEVYNFREIRNELEKYGYIFDGNSDTEVILKAYHKWGIKAVDKFNGMFAIAVYDKKLEELILIRDRAGVKPLYYYFKDNLFIFASELKSFYQHRDFKKKINTNVLALYLQYGYIMEPYSIFQDTFKLKAGYYLELDIKKLELKTYKYWDVLDLYSKSKLQITEEEAINKIDEILNSAFSYRMVADVPVGIFLSGGYDSSIVTAILQSKHEEKLNTFTIGFKEKGFDEAPYAKQVANYLGTNHTEYYCTQKDALKIIPRLPEIYDEPFGDSSAIPTTLVSQLARKDVVVSLSADGGDEIFGGYTKYTDIIRHFYRFLEIPDSLKFMITSGMNIINPNYIPYLNKTYNFETRYKKVQNLLKAKTLQCSMKYISQHFTSNQVKILLKGGYQYLLTNFDIDTNKDDLNNLLAIDYKTYLVDDILTKVDRATMSVSLEGREPFLDHRIIEFLAQLPNDMKIKNGDKKYLLKQLTHKYIPKNIMDRQKKGFGVPIQEWFKDELKDYFLKYLSKERLEEEDLLNVDEVLRLRDKYLNGDKENIQRLWFILMFEMWYERWI